MPSLKQIRRRIVTVRNTKQITRAMKLVSAAKLRRAQDAAVNGRAFVEEMSRIMRTVLGDLPADFTNPLIVRDGSAETEGNPADTAEKRRCILVVAGERGLCGAFNTNIIKSAQQEILAAGGPVDVIAIGRRAVSTGKRLGWNIIAEFEGLPEDASKWPAEKISEHFVTGFREGRYREVAVHFTKFVSALTQRPTREILLPLSQQSLSLALEESLHGGGASSASGATTSSAGQVKYSPAPAALFEQLVPVLVRARMLQAGLETKASEHAARMTAMDSATNNANDLIERLKLYYNRARQSTITKELMDIIGGAEAIS